MSEGGEYGASSLNTPSRASEADKNNPNNRQNAAGGPSNDNKNANTGGNPEGGIPTNNSSKNGVNAGSCLAGPHNPKTAQRKSLASSGNDVIVHFDERVVVHTVPYWDPCGETYYDDDNEDNPRGPNCCTIL